MKKLESPIEYLKGVGPAKGELLRKELGVYTFGDLLVNYPFRYVDKTKFHKVRDLNTAGAEVQIKGILRSVNTIGEGGKKRLVAKLRDDTGVVELVWFRGIHWLSRSLEVGKEYIVFGKVNEFNRKFNIPHPEIEAVNLQNAREESTFSPVYASTEKLNNRGLDSKGRRRLLKTIFEQIKMGEDLPENLPDYMIEKLKLVPHSLAMKNIHFPKSQKELDLARFRLKFEELFFLQLRLLRIKRRRVDEVRGFVFKVVGDYFHQFFNEKLPFELTGAQKRVVKEIRRDLGAGSQMNRLLQGDVGSGKTIVALLSMLIAIDNGYQAVLVAPTEILAQQHYIGISEDLEGIDLKVAFLAGSVKGKKRKLLLEELAEGKINILVGTHAVFEDPVIFKNLGLAIIDEQHRFGVAQRSKLWKKSSPYPAHIMVMSATPIPRTLAMTLYGDLEVSVIDELPPGRKEIDTSHKMEGNRLRVIGFMKEQIKLGRQIYIVYPLIEESEKLDLANLMSGYETLLRDFPMPEYQISIVHGRMKAKEKDFEMQRFIKNETQIMIATTVIEVGVNVPNASVMIIENAERFGLSQLHQLRGRVGRGAEKSYCILMTSYKLSDNSKERLATMVRTNNGFEIAEADLKLRGSGNIEGTQQSGVINLNLADLGTDQKILTTARAVATQILEKDPKLEHPANARLAAHMRKKAKNIKVWSRIS